MICCIFLLHVLLICSFHEKHQAVALSTSTFVISFQNSGVLSTDEWVEITQNIPPLKEFTACHWEKIRYFSSQSMPIWSYCIADRSKKDDINCTQIYSKGNIATANQQLKLCIRMNSLDYCVNINDTRHRTWNHICWSYSSDTKSNKLYYNGAKAGTIPVEDGIIIPASDDFKSTSFILGQEPDSFNGEFSLAQLFIGDLSEVNLWDKILDDGVISEMSRCKTVLKGNTILWKEDSIKNHGALIQPNIDMDDFCKELERYVVFATKEPMPIARNLCTSHGGQIITPESVEENDLMMKLLEKHKDACLQENPMRPADAEKAAWLGLRKESSGWNYLNENGLRIKPNFTNWSNQLIDGLKDTDCTYLNSDGKWSWTATESCYLELCTICKVVGNPVFTVNGLCFKTDFDFNYYIVLDNLNRINYYEGFKVSNIIKEDGSWAFSPKRGNGLRKSKISFEFGEYDVYPVGRRSWSIYDPKCQIHATGDLSISKCRFGKEFTCDSGNCLGLEKRCNQVKDCDDGSDEKGCSLVQLPDNYRKVQAPEPLNHSEPLPITVFTRIDSIDVNTIDMRIGLTMYFNMGWNDSRLRFANLIDDSHNQVNPATVHKLWVPLDYVTHTNAMVGKIYSDSSKDVEIHALATPIPMNFENAIQNTMYDGGENRLFVSQRHRVMYNCDFQFKYFPFDTQTCNFKMRMEVDKFSAISFKRYKDARYEGFGVEYVGQRIFSEFEIDRVTAKTGTKESHTFYEFTIEFHRIWTDQIIGTFFPTILLWLLAYFSLFIRLENFNERVMLAVTTLLVLAALLSSIKDRIPGTSYFKYIDLWVLWYTCFIFSISVFHVLLHKGGEKMKNKKISVKAEGIIGVKRCNPTSGEEKINEMAKKWILLPFFLFNIIYFVLQF